MARAYSDEENEQWAEEQRIEALRRIGQGLPPIAPGSGRPPLPRSRARSLPPHLGGAPIEAPPRAAPLGSQTKPIVRQIAGAELGSRANTNMKTGAEAGSLGNPLVRENVNRTVGQPATRQLPTRGLSEASGILRAQNPSGPVDQESVVKATGQGFSNGFLGGIAQAPGEPRQSLDDTKQRSVDLMTRVRSGEEGERVSVGHAARAVNSLPEGKRASALADVQRRSADLRLREFANNDDERGLAGVGNIKARAGLPTADQDAQQFAMELPGLAGLSPVAAQMLVDGVGPGAGGYIAAMTTVNERLASAPAGSFSNGFPDGMSPSMPSALGAIGEIAEAAEESSIQSAGLAARMEKFPELKGVELPTGNAARFPELAEEAPRPDTQQEEQDGDFDR